MSPGVNSLVGQPAPALLLPNSNGESVTLQPGADNIPIALFFYPKAGSYGCTKEACQFRDLMLGELGREAFQPGKIRIVGISPDSVERQRVFVQKYKLPFTVLSDAHGHAKSAYRVGKALLGYYECARATFVIDGNGIVRAVLDTTFKFSAHCKFVAHWLHQFELEDACHRGSPSSPQPPRLLTSSSFNLDVSNRSMASSNNSQTSAGQAAWDDDPGLFTTQESLRSRSMSTPQLS